MKQLELGAPNVECPKCGAMGDEPCHDTGRRRPRRHVHKERIIAEAAVVVGK